MGPVPPPKDKIKLWKDVLERGPRIQALCIGVNAYKEWDTLSNAVADAEIVASNVRDLPESRVREVCTNPATKASLEKAVSDFVLHIEKNSAPQIVLIFYAGHGIQEGDRIYLVPANAKKEPVDAAELEEQCLSHDKLFRLLKEKLDDQIDVKDVLYLVILDACRKMLGTKESTQAGFSEEIHEPPSAHRPEHWLLCTSTSRREFAYDGADRHSLFVQEILSDECGLFHRNVTVAKALKLVCKRLGTQKPCLMPSHNIPDSLCLRVHEPQRAQDSKFDVFLCYRGGGEDRTLALKLRDKLKSLYIEREGCERRPLTVFLEAGHAPPTANEQAANTANEQVAMQYSSVILVLISRSTLDGIDGLQQDTSVEHSRLAQLLWQYEMALELCEFGQRKVVPLLLGRKTRENFFDDSDEVDQHQEFWPSHAPDLRVASVLKDALDGLRCSSVVATGLDDKTLDRVGGIPSII